LSKRPAGALAGIAMIFLLAASVGATSLGSASPRSGLGHHVEAGVVPDIVFGKPDAAAARISATASRSRYEINDGTDSSIAVSISAACQVSCTDADPQHIANLIGTLLHGPEVDMVNVQLDAPFEIEFDCGYGAQACYYPSQNKIVLNGNDTAAADGASRDMVLAHEYGHHVENYQRSPAPFPEPLEWGTPRWASHENVCQLRREGKVFPGDGGVHYFQEPGEAFAESFAHYHFRHSGVGWRWLGGLKPDAGAFKAIREDTLRPWSGRANFPLVGRVPPRSRGPVVKSFRTPIDGTVSVRPVRVPPRRYELSIRNPAGHLLSSSRAGLNLHRQLNFTICGQSRLRVLLRARHRPGSPFKLRIQRP